MSTNPNFISFFKDHRFTNYNLVDDAVQFGPNDYYNFNDHMLEYLFFNPLYEPIRGKNPDGPDHRKYWLEDPYEYRRNTYTFRCDEFERDAEFVFAGCSHTYGMGVPEDMIWGVHLAKKLGVKYYNLGIPGASVSTIVNNLFAYFRLFGHPKNLVISFPNFERLLLPVNLKVLSPGSRDFSSHIKNDIPLNDLYLEHSYLMENIHPKFSKKPHKVEEVVPLDVPYWMATQSINLLEQYCDIAGINLVWTTWDFMTYRSLKKMHDIDGTYFKNMIDGELDHWVAHDFGGLDAYHKESVQKDDPCLSLSHCDRTVKCHKEIQAQYPEIFDLAADDAHWGTHRHIHLAETFYKHLKDKI